MTKEDKKIIEMSGKFLTEYLPDDFQSWEDEKLYDWIEENVWQPYEGWSGKDLFNQILSCSKQTNDPRIAKRGSGISFYFFLFFFVVGGPEGHKHN